MVPVKPHQVAAIDLEALDPPMYYDRFDDDPPECGEGGGPPTQECPPEYPPCGLPGQDPCPADSYCTTGCCVPLPQ